MLAYTEDTMYYSSQPTDVTSYYEDKKIMQEYSSMMEKLTYIEKPLKINKPDVKYDAKEFVFPMSQTVKFNLEDYNVYFANMETKCYYVTDISRYDQGLEIAFMDYGPSDDLVTYFFTYTKGKLIYVGEVGGFPFADYTGYNAFSVEGLVESSFRADLINTCYAYKTCRYDNEKKRLVELKYDMYPMMAEKHELLVDLPVYETNSVKSKKITMKAKQDVFFIETDGKAWIKVKAKDGTEGYINIKKMQVTNVKKPATDVFTDLVFCD